WWRLGSEPHPDSPQALRRKADRAALARIESELNHLDYADPTKRHERGALRERRSALEIARAVRELVAISAFDDRETRAYLREARRLLDASASSFERPEDLQ